MPEPVKNNEELEAERKKLELTMQQFGEFGKNIKWSFVGEYFSGGNWEPVILFE